MKLSDAHELCNDLLHEHGLSQRGWTFFFDRSKKRFGQCVRSKLSITLSAYLVQLNDERKVRETMLHEIAHALAPAGAHHGPAWKHQCRLLGIAPNRCYDSSVETPPGRYTGTCENCGHTFEKHRKPKSTTAYCIRTSKCKARKTPIQWRMR